MGEAIDDTALDTLFREARTYAKWQPRPVDGSDAAGSLRAAEVGADQRERRPGAVRVSPIEGSQRTASSGAGPAQRREDDDRARHRDRRLRPEVLRAAAEAVPAQPRHGEAVREQPRAGRSDREAEFQPAGRVPDHGRAGARPRLRADVRASIRRRSTRSSLPPASPVSAAIRNSSLKDT